MASKLRRICEDEINALDQRVGVLLGDAELESDASPLSPQAICDAYKKTCRTMIESLAVRGVFLKLFDDHVLDEIRSIYKALNDLLVQNSILPKIRYGLAKEGGKPPRSARGKEHKAEADDEPAGEQDMFQPCKNFSPENQAAARGPGGGGNGLGGVRYWRVSSCSAP